MNWRKGGRRLVKGKAQVDSWSSVRLKDWVGREGGVSAFAEKASLERTGTGAMMVIGGAG